MRVFPICEVIHLEERLKEVGKTLWLGPDKLLLNTLRLQHQRPHQVNHKAREKWIWYRRTYRQHKISKKIYQSCSHLELETREHPVNKKILVQAEHKI